MTDISKTCMIVNITVGTWLAHKHDKQASVDAVANANAGEADALSVSKHLIPKADLKTITTAQSQVRTHFYEQTLPWKDSGDRLLVRARFEKFIERHTELVQVVNDNADAFVKKTYPSIRSRAQFRMGKSFSKADYPPPDVVCSKFYVRLDIDSITDESDFRVSLSKEQLSRVKKEIAGNLEDRINRALGGVGAQLEKTLGHFTERMKSDDKFKIATIDNLRELVDELPALNITNNPDLKKISDRIKASLFDFEADEIRKNPKVRKKIAKEAEDIMEDMAGFMKAFQTS